MTDETKSPCTVIYLAGLLPNSRRRKCTPRERLRQTANTWRQSGWAAIIIDCMNIALCTQCTQSVIFILYNGEERYVIMNSLFTYSGSCSRFITMKCNQLSIIHHIDYPPLTSAIKTIKTNFCNLLALDSPPRLIIRQQYCLVPMSADNRDLTSGWSLVANGWYLEQNGPESVYRIKYTQPQWRSRKVEIMSEIVCEWKTF